jgi:hypothetical protein
MTTSAMIAAKRKSGKRPSSSSYIRGFSLAVRKDDRFLCQVHVCQVADPAIRATRSKAWLERPRLRIALPLSIPQVLFVR